MKLSLLKCRDSVSYFGDTVSYCEDTLADVEILSPIRVILSLILEILSPNFNSRTRRIPAIIALTREADNE